MFMVFHLDCKLSFKVASSPGMKNARLRLNFKLFTNGKSIAETTYVSTEFKTVKSLLERLLLSDLKDFRKQ